METRKLHPESRERLKETLREYSIPVLIEVLGLVRDQLEQRGVILEVSLDGEELPI